MTEILIAGAGPVGLVAATLLGRRGLKVTVLEAGAELSRESRASTFHPPTLDMLDDLGAADVLVAQGLKAPVLQYRTRDELIAAFDFSRLANITRHPYRLQAEQFKLTAILAQRLAALPNVTLRFNARVAAVAQDADRVTVTLEDGAVLRGDWLIGADGASSAVRKSLGIAFDGFTWQERFLVVSTPFDFMSAIPDLSSVSYVADPAQWHFFLQIPGLWRMMFPVAPEITDEVAVGRDYVQAQMATLVPGVTDYPVSHTTLYRVHQRTAATYRQGRVFLAGDAAHVNNPLGGMGMNGGIHDAVNLAGRLADVAEGADPVSLDRYERQRRQVNIEYVQAQTIRNKQNLEARDPVAHAEFRSRMRATAQDPELSYKYLLAVAMIDSLRRAEEIT
jgi:3-(3-hydroxy-phenyl)propionate hydroxylase